MWLMEHRGADGLSHCGSDDEERRGSPHNDEDENEGDGDAAGDKSSKSASASDAAVLRTAGAGLPLARVKRVMKHADDEIKVSVRRFTAVEGCALTTIAVAMPSTR